MSTLGEIGEHEAIRRILPLLGRHDELVVAAGDDCAVCRMPGAEIDQVFTTDPIIEGVHFAPGEIPERVGNKAAGRVLSDIAAMGARPRWLLVNVVAPPTLEFGYLEKIYAGMSALLERFGALVIGGDLAKGPVLELHVFGVGEVPSGSAVLRSGARVGDSIFVTGALGGSLEGKHLDFTPCVEQGILLRETGRVNAMMDVSDGLATDLRHILSRSGVGARLDSTAIPKNGTLEQALFDGEDFELLFTAPAEIEGAWRDRPDFHPTRIGEVTNEGGVLRLDGAALEGKAFEHFAG